MAKRARRDVVIDVLRLVGVPLAPGTIGGIARATFGEEAPSTPSGMLALVAADKKRYATARHDGALIVPLLSAYDNAFTPYSGYFAISDFPLEIRLMNYASFRLYEARTFLRLLDLWESGQYARWNAQAWNNPVKRAWFGKARAYELTEAGRAAMRSEALDALAQAEQWHSELTKQSISAAVQLPEIERLYGKPFPIIDAELE